jgi:hypothetical protein
LAVERVFVVEFGPSRSRRLQRAVAQARGGAGVFRELGYGRYSVRFVLAKDAVVYMALARLLQQVGAWRASEVNEQDEFVSTYHAREMAWCGFSQLDWFNECRVRFFHGVPPRCSLCPLFDIERARLDVLGENTPNLIEFRLTLGLAHLPGGRVAIPVCRAAASRPKLEDPRLDSARMAPAARRREARGLKTALALRQERE